MVTTLVIDGPEQALDALEILDDGQQKERRSLVKDIVEYGDPETTSRLLAAIFARSPGVRLSIKPKLTRTQLDQMLKTLLQKGEWQELTQVLEWLLAMRGWHTICQAFATRVVKEGGLSGAFTLMRILPFGRFQAVRSEALQVILRSKYTYIADWHPGTQLSNSEADRVIKKVSRYAAWGWARVLLERNLECYSHISRYPLKPRYLLPMAKLSSVVTLVAKQQRISDLEDFLKRESSYLPRKFTAREGSLIVHRMIQLAFRDMRTKEWNWQQHVSLILTSEVCKKYLTPAELEELKVKLQLVNEGGKDAQRHS